QTNSVPLGGSGWSMGLKTQPGAEIEATPTAIYFVDEQAVGTYGVDLVAGDNFAPSDVTWRAANSRGWGTQVIVSKALATKLFPDDANYGVGKTIYINDTEPLTIRGVVDKLQAPWSGWDEGIENTTLVPQHLLGNSTSYLVRTEAGRRDALMPQIESLLAE